MIRLELQLELAYEIRDSDGADFVFNIQAAQTPHQTVEDERLVVNQAVTPEVATDPATA
ncbi:MAG TPA: transglutaminase family protein, partial [Ramlibacter sp.]